MLHAMLYNPGFVGAASAGSRRQGMSYICKTKHRLVVRSDCWLLTIMTCFAGPWSLLWIAGWHRHRGEASGGRAQVRLASDLSLDVVLLDLRMPDMDGTECARAILQSRPETRIVALTIADRDEDIAAMLQAGACAFLVKDSPIEDVVAAVRAAATAPPGYRLVPPRRC